MKDSLEVCTRVGARLCTLAELSSGAASNTGCGYNNEWVWSGTACTLSGAPGRYQILDETQAVCAPRSHANGTAFVRCCADSITQGSSSDETAAAAADNNTSISNGMATGIIVLCVFTILVVAIAVVQRRRTAASTDKTRLGDPSITDASSRYPAPRYGGHISMHDVDFESMGDEIPRVHAPTDRSNSDSVGDDDSEVSDLVMATWIDMGKAAMDEKNRRQSRQHLSSTVQTCPSVTFTKDNACIQQVSCNPPTLPAMAQLMLNMMHIAVCARALAVVWWCGYRCVRIRLNLVASAQVLSQRAVLTRVSHCRAVGDAIRQRYRERRSARATAATLST
eukprot:m.865212 g.865212  ORF g.865212 m.865212 type:complete len:337 (-) comp23549_c0_seq3:726-1736(-)